MLKALRTPVLRSVFSGTAVQRASIVIPTRKVNVVNVYQQTPSLIKRGENPLKEVQKDLIAQQDPTGWKTRLFDKKNSKCIKTADIVRVTKTDGTSFTGIVLAISRRGISTNFILRTKIGGVGVENRYQLYNPLVKNIEIIRVPKKRWPRAKIYFTRGTKRDVGDVDLEVRKQELKERKSVRIL